MHQDYYVYLYFRLDGRPLYLGKGRADRWKQHQHRKTNPHFMNVLAQAKALSKELPVVFLHENLSEKKALEYECALIQAIGRETQGGPLINQTDGGEGMSGWRPGAETLARMSAAAKGVPKTPTHAANAAEARKRTGWRPSKEHAEAVSAANKGIIVPEERRARIKATMISPENYQRTLSGIAKARVVLAEKRARAKEQ